MFAGEIGSQVELPGALREEIDDGLRSFVEVKVALISKLVGGFFLLVRIHVFRLRSRQLHVVLGG